MKRKLSLSPSTDQVDEEGNSTKIRKTEFKREYSKLRKLVPALNARNDITKVWEIRIIIYEPVKNLAFLFVKQTVSNYYYQNSFIIYTGF